MTAKVRAHHTSAENVLAGWLGVEIAPDNLKPRRRPHRKTPARRGHEAVRLSRGSRRGAEQMSLL